MNDEELYVEILTEDEDEWYIVLVIIACATNLSTTTALHKKYSYTKKLNAKKDKANGYF